MSASRDEDDRETLGGKPATPTDDDLLEKCDSDRAGLTPKETADCAGMELSDLYENEEDGGS